MLAQDAVPATRPPAVAGETSAVSCRNVSMRFVTDRRTVTALENISFSVERGGFLSLLGPSGCGKSTLLRIADDRAGFGVRHVAAGGAAEALAGIRVSGRRTAALAHRVAERRASGRGRRFCGPAIRRADTA